MVAQNHVKEVEKEDKKGGQWRKATANDVILLII
jgi:hypothetical protein